MKLWGGQRGNDFIGDIFKLHNIHKCKVIVGELREYVLLEAANGRQMALVLEEKTGQLYKMFFNEQTNATLENSLGNVYQ